jgi:hypothetical protein
MFRREKLVLAVLPGLSGVGLILNELPFAGSVLILLSAGLVLADFRWSAVPGRPARLVAKGSPALLMVALMLGAAQGFVAAKDALLPVLTAQVMAGVGETDANLLIARALELLL